MILRDMVEEVGCQTQKCLAHAEGKGWCQIQAEGLVLRLVRWPPLSWQTLWNQFTRELAFVQITEIKQTWIDFGERLSDSPKEMAFCGEGLWL